MRKIIKKTSLAQRTAAGVLALLMLACAGCGSSNMADEAPSSSLAYGDVVPSQQESSTPESSSSAASKASSSEAASKESSSAASSKSVSSKAASSKATSSKNETSKAASSKSASSKAEQSSSVQPQASSSQSATSTASVQQPASQQPAQQTETASEQPEESSEAQQENEPEPQPDPEPQPKPEPRPDGSAPLVVIDAGHQSVGNYSHEPIGPGAWETKAKVTGGTQGRATGIPEYELTLALALGLGDLLEQQGCEVIQVRTSNDVDISNSERAAVANSNSADVFIRIHANGSDDTSVTGAMTICQTPYNPYNGDLYEQSRALSEFVLNDLVAATGCRREYVWETDTMSGINWAQVPVTIVEVGYMSNYQEDILLSQDDYRAKICEGLANGIIEYLNNR